MGQPEKIEQPPDSEHAVREQLDYRRGYPGSDMPMDELLRQAEAASCPHHTYDASDWAERFGAPALRRMAAEIRGLRQENKRLSDAYAGVVGLRGDPQP